MFCAIYMMYQPAVTVWMDTGHVGLHNHIKIWHERNVGTFSSFLDAPHTSGLTIGSRAR